MGNPTESDRILRYPEVEQLLGGVHRVTLDRWIREGRFPPSFKISPGGRACGWRHSVVMAWMAERAGEPR
jgi:predicted DNA-binding transcriptional regulator AlpA